MRTMEYVVGYWIEMSYPLAVAKNANANSKKILFWINRLIICHFGHTYSSGTALFLYNKDKSLKRCEIFVAFVLV